ncbi:M28 family peptidase [Pedobacter sp. HMF7647]|uniref:M28 family peptidase n=1 Tax=Hufsiella arboris TaxID=2695275 RepID=A0A7K1Y905_9SPHI|nr:M28 family peptidase [Hufsiella arboris]MXV51074.1 M28 family peptidase [Hufsiella arboris]
MNKKNLLFLALGLSLQTFAQSPVAQKYAGYITAEDARKHLTILASDEFEGRETGKPGAEKAAKYIAGEFQKMGLTAPVKGSYFQDIPLIETTFEVKNFIANQKPFTYGTDFYFSGSPDANSITTKEIVFVGYGITDSAYNDLKNIDITNKIVLVINTGEPVKNGTYLITKSDKPSDWSITRNKRIKFLQSKNPALILAVNPAVAAILKTNASYFTSGRLSIKQDAAKPKQTLPPVINITADIADQLLQKSGKTYTAFKNLIDSTSAPQTQVVKADLSTSFGQKFKDVHAVNVLGYLEGSDLKNEVVVFSAHYDHIGLNPTGPDKVNNGADDDGSGTTGILEIARAYTKAKKEGHGPRRSILFLGNVGEEKGLLGSEYYTDHPVIPLERTITDLNIDMIGRVDPAHKDNPNYCYLIGSDKLSTTLHKISETANSTYTKLAIDYKYNDPKDPEQIYYRSDHYNFAKHNIPIIFYFNGVHEDYHKPGDEVSKINFDLLVKRAQLVFYTGWDLLNRDQKPVVDVKNNMPASR